ncbi:MAG: hypothetical protein Q7J06_02770 [Bacteroidales bacterium]|nr:hypothetical protein [Bacteroidales bacterium]
MATKKMRGRWILTGLALLALVVLADWPRLALASPGPTIEITAPTDITAWTLSPQGTQPKETTGTLTVTTTDAVGLNWSVTASDTDTTNTNGQMTKYSGAAYVLGTKLGTAMQVNGPAGTVTLPTGGDVVATSGTVTGQGYTITFKQTVLWSDAVVTGADSYRIVVTFTGSISG